MITQMADKTHDAEYISKIAQKIFVKSVQNNIKLTPKGEIESVDDSFENLTDDTMNAIHSRYLAEESDNSFISDINLETHKMPGMRKRRAPRNRHMRYLF